MYYANVYEMRTKPLPASATKPLTYGETQRIQEDGALLHRLVYSLVRIEILSPHP